MHSSTLLFLLALCSSALATGHLRLEFTASHDCDLLLSTDFSAEIISLRMGETKTSSFHPRNGELSIPIAFSVGQATKKYETFSLETSKESRRDVFVFSEITVLVQSIVECDSGFYGPLCTSNQKPTTSSSTSSTTSTTTTTTTTVISTSTATEETSLITSRIPKIVTPLPLQNQTSSTNLVIIVLIFVIVTLLIFIIVVCVLLLTRQRKVYIESTCESPELKKKWMDTSFEKDSGIQSPESVRYTAAPFKSVNLFP